MRSNRPAGDVQASLWDDAAEPDAATIGGVAPSVTERRVRRPRARGSVSAPVELFDPSGVHRLESDDFAASGWPAGSLLLLRPASRAVRGELVVVREAGRTKVGWFGADRGRPALRTDVGAAWLSDRARVVATVLAVEPTLVEAPSGDSS